MNPRRIQRSRAKGWRMPEGAVYVGRPSRWGNPYSAGKVPWNHLGRERYRVTAMYRDRIGNREPVALERWLAPLRGRDLVCWCPLDQPCHADVLLELANA